MHRLNPGPPFSSQHSVRLPECNGKQPILLHLNPWLWIPLFVIYFWSIVYMSLDKQMCVTGTLHMGWWVWPTRTYNQADSAASNSVISKSETGKFKFCRNGLEPRWVRSAWSRGLKKYVGSSLPTAFPPSHFLKGAPLHWIASDAQWKKTSSFSWNSTVTVAICRISGEFSP